MARGQRNIFLFVFLVFPGIPPLGIPVRLCHKCLDLNPSSFHPPRPPVLQNGTLRSRLSSYSLTFPASPDTACHSPTSAFLPTFSQDLQPPVGYQWPQSCSQWRSVHYPARHFPSLHSCKELLEVPQTGTSNQPILWGASQYLLSGTQASNILATSSHTELDGQLEISPWRPLS